MRDGEGCFLYEHQLHQQHIADRAAGDGNKGLVLPFVEGDGHGDGEGLRDAAAARKVLRQ